MPIKLTEVGMKHSEFLFINKIVNKNKSYFNSIAPDRKRQRKAKSYYWNDITRYCDFFIHEDYSVLEIGCGTGELLAGLKAKDKTGIDFSEGMIAEANLQFPGLDFRLMEAGSSR
jgi:ubiquinone/menaquinone biosynthesis C-methylase UbiE